MANLVVRPSAAIGLGFYNTAWTVFPPVPYADAIKEIVEDGDASYVAATVPGAAFTTKLSTTAVGESWPRPTRIRGALVVVTVRRTGGDPAQWRLRWRHSDTNYDSQILSVDTASYREFYLYWPQMPNGAGWTTTVLQDFELGMVYVGGGTELRCTKIEVHLHTELEPHFRLEPSSVGSFSAWALSTPSLPAEQLVNGAFDGDLSYVQSVTPGAKATFVPGSSPPLGSLAIDRVQAKALVRTTATVNSAQAGSILVAGGVPYRGGQHQLLFGAAPNSYPSEFAWTILEGEYTNCPTTGWPCGDSLATPWTPLELAGVEVGVENGSAIPARCTSIGLDVFLKHVPVSTFDLFPTANDVWHADLPPLVPNVGEQAWQDICEDPPDDAASYIGATTTDLISLYATFAFGPIPVIPPGEQISALELRSRLTLGATPAAVVAFAMNDQVSGETWISKPFLLSGVAGTWFDLKEDWFTDALLGGRWNIGSLATRSFGMVVLAGEAWISRIRVQVQTAPVTLTAMPDPVDFQVTNDGQFWITKSGLDGSIYEIDTFAMGSGGYNPLLPTSVLAVNPADTALAAEVWRGPIKKVTYQADALPRLVTYWCRVPRSALLGNVVGEMGLFARVLWSPVPAEIGLVFLYALAHFSGQVCVDHDVLLLPAQITYP